MPLNTPVTSSEFNPLNTLSYMPPVTATAQSALPQIDSPFYSSASSNYSVSPAPSVSIPAAVPENVFGRGPVIVPSATAQPQKPRRKGGRKPKNDPVCIYIPEHTYFVTSEFGKFHPISHDSALIQLSGQ